MIGMMVYSIMGDCYGGQGQLHDCGTRRDVVR